MEGSIEGFGEVNDAQVSAGHFTAMENNVACSGELGNTGAQQVPSSTDIHEEINRKLEELENLGREEHLAKVNDSFASETNMSVVSESSAFAGEVPENASASDIQEAVSKLDTAEEVTGENLASNLEQDIVSCGETVEEPHNVIDVNQKEGELVAESVAEKHSEGDRDSAVCQGQIDDTQTPVDAVNQEKQGESCSLSQVDAVAEVEHKIKDIVGEATKEVTVNNENPVISEPDEIQQTHPAEKMEISEVNPADVVEAEELPIEFTVVDETSPQSQEVPIVEEVQTEVVTSHGDAADVHVDSAVSNEQIVFVEEISSADDSFKGDNSQQSSDNELFVVTHGSEPENDPLQPQSQQPPKEEKPKKPRGRKSNNTIPSHVLGVNIKNPSADASINGSGRQVLKPRLGVKVPYRNLSSQIVSKQEIEAEIMERYRQRQAQQAAEKSDVMFARKLTQRLASKIVPDAMNTKPDITALAALTKTEAKTEQSSSTPVKLPPSSARIEKDSDLLAILEGDDDDLLSEEATEKERKEAEQKVKQMEREIALKQLKDLPSTLPVIKTKSKTEDAKSPVKHPKQSGTSPGTNHAASQNRVKTKDSSSHSAKKAPSDVVPRLKANMVLKTYSRKRKSTDVEAFINPKKASVPEQNSITKTSAIDLKPEKSSFTIDQKGEKKTSVKDEKKPNAENKSEGANPANAYVTKSSRVIKKKVIWDPDEVVSPRSVVRSPKPVEHVGTSKQPTSVSKSAEKKVLTAEKQTEKKIPEKQIEKKPFDKPEKKVVALEKKPTSAFDKSPQKKVSPKKGKRLSEIDKLLMDEGAVNMLYEVKNVEDVQSKLKKKAKTVISIEKAEKELRNKASELLKDLKQNSITTEESPKTLRKKDSPPLLKKEVVMPGSIMRKKSKDSARSSVHSPPASPACPYEASRIIRRHSSSSFSSGDEPLSDKVPLEKASKKRLAPPSDVPKAKKLKKSTETSTPQKTKVGTDNDASKDAEKQAVDDSKPPSPTRTLTLKRTDRILTIKLNYGENEPYFTPQVLKELTITLNRLAKDPNCNGVVVTSAASAYCLGLDYKVVIDSDQEARKKKATELAARVRDFLKCLLHFPKVLVAGVQGDCVGLGVTMLSLFDMVIASDKAQFSMPYGSLGCAPEAAFLMTLPHISSHGLASELFYTSSKLSASEVSRHGLVTRLCWPEKYADELKNINLNISQQSRQAIESAKKQLRSTFVQSTEAAITSQTKVLVEHWISDECQDKLSSVKMETE